VIVSSVDVDGPSVQMILVLGRCIGIVGFSLSLPCITAEGPPIMGYMGDKFTPEPRS